MTSLHRLLSNTLSLVAGFGSSQALTAVAYILVARAIAPSDFGELAAYMGVAMLVVSVGDFGFTAWVVRELARPGSPVTFAASIDVRSAVAAAAGSAWIFVTTALALIGDAPGYVVFFGVWIGFALLTSTLLAPLQANERMREVAVVAALERLVLLAAVSVGVLVGLAAPSMAFGLALGSFAGAVTAARLARAPMRDVRFPGVRSLLRALRASAGFAVSALALQVQRVDTALVSIIAGPYQAGIYAAPARVTNALGIIPISFTTALFPMAAKESGAIWTRRLAGLLIGMLVVMTAIVAPLFVFSDQLVEAVLGSEYIASGDVLRIILVGLVMGSLNNPIAIVYQARGLEHFVAKAVTVGSAIGLTIVSLGAARAGAEGAAIGFVAQQIAVMAVLLAKPLLQVSRRRGRWTLSSRSRTPRSSSVDSDD
jgi:O-antigen/teichoic acid export membrane protein